MRNIFFSVKQKNEWFGGQQIDISFFTINWMERKLELMWYFLRIIKRILKHFILSEMEQKVLSSIYHLKYCGAQGQPSIRGLGLY
jgi:hypothetical protein